MLCGQMGVLKFFSKRKTASKECQGKHPPVTRRSFHGEMGSLRRLCHPLPVNCSLNTSCPWGPRTQRVAPGWLLHSDLGVGGGGLHRSSCPLSHRFKITGDQQLKPIPVLCSEQSHTQLFCSGVGLAHLPMAWAM